AVRGRHSTESMQQDSRFALLDACFCPFRVSEEWLHTGDLVLLKVYLRDSEGYVEAATNTQVEGVDDFHTGTVDVRDFIFVVVEQLSHHRPTPDSPRTANSGPIDPGPAVYALQLRSLEERAKMEAVDGASKGSQLEVSGSSGLGGFYALSYRSQLRTFRILANTASESPFPHSPS
ncbi:unnamed protein product, partial [Symbiodinium necroappetens]